MKYLGEKSLSHILKIILNIFWVFGWLALITLIVPSFYSIFIEYRGGLNTILTLGVIFITLNIIFIIAQLRKILTTLIDKEPFTLSNVKRFRYIGYSTLTIGFLLFTKAVYLKGLGVFTILDDAGSGITTNIEVFIPFILGIFSLILAEIFKLGYKIHTENKLTI